MKTDLDSSKYWFVHHLSYQENLRILVTEGIVGAQPEHQEMSENLFPVNVADNSRTLDIKFTAPIAWQVIQERFCIPDKNEVGETVGILRKIERSKYLDYVNESHGWYKDVIGPATHYRLICALEIIDVISLTEPKITLIDSNN